MNIDRVLIALWADGVLLEREGDDLMVRAITPTIPVAVRALLVLHNEELKRLFRVAPNTTRTA
jgi:hypothetical protein